MGGPPLAYSGESLRALAGAAPPPHRCYFFITFICACDTKAWHHVDVYWKAASATLDRVFARPTPADIRWADIESMLEAVGVEVSAPEQGAFALAAHQGVS